MVDDNLAQDDLALAACPKQLTESRRAGNDSPETAGWWPCSWSGEQTVAQDPWAKSKHSPADPVPGFPYMGKVGGAGDSANSARILGHLSISTGKALRGFPTFLGEVFLFQINF